MVISLLYIQLNNHTRDTTLQSTIQTFVCYKNRVKNLSSPNKGILGVGYKIVQNTSKPRCQHFRQQFVQASHKANGSKIFNIDSINLLGYVDSIPIRVFRNYENEGIAYPNKQGMRVYSSLWNADNWATRGGLEKINWTCSPFVAKFSQFRPRACLWQGSASISQCASNTTAANWYTSPGYKQLSSAKFGQLNWVRDNFMIYDYCKDTKRFNGQLPPECFKQQF